MPSELLHFPPSYTLVGLYRLLADPFIREPVLDKVKHAFLRGVVVSTIYSITSWSTLHWFVRKFLVGGVGWFGLGMGRARAKVGEAVRESSAGMIRVGLGGLGVDVDLVLCTCAGFEMTRTHESEGRYAPLDTASADFVDTPILHLQEPKDRAVEGLRADRRFSREAERVLVAGTVHPLSKELL